MLVAIVVFFICGCAGLNNRLSTNSESKPLWSYGNFCGGGYPRNSQGLRPVDDLDLVCFYHDKCYEAAGRASAYCDRALSENIIYLGELFKKQNYEGIRQKCMNALIEVNVFANSNLANDESIGLKAIKAFTRIQQAPALLLLSGLMDHGTSDSPSLCNAKADALKLIAPLSAQELKHAQYCQEELENTEETIKNSYVDYKIRKDLAAKRSQRIGRNRTFKDMQEYLFMRGCDNFPVRGRV